MRWIGILNCSRLLGWTIGALVFALRSPVMAHAQHDSLERVLNALQDRQKEITSAMFSFTVARVDKKGACAFLSRTSGKPMPPKDAAYAFEGQLLFDGLRVRYDRKRTSLGFGQGRIDIASDL